MNKQRPVNFIHFPKVGGKSIRVQLECERADELQLYYNNPIHNNIIRRKYLQKLHKLRGLNRRIVFGHFSYNDRLHRSEDTINLVVIRSPIDWLGSLYQYWTQKHDYNIGMLEFINKHQLQSAYDKFLGNKPEQYFDLIGFYEEFDKFLENASELIELELYSRPYNVTSNKYGNYEDIISQREDYTDIKIAMEKNIKIYETLRSIF